MITDTPVSAYPEALRLLILAESMAAALWTASGTVYCRPRHWHELSMREQKRLIEFAAETLKVLRPDPREGRPPVFLRLAIDNARTEFRHE